MTRALPSLTSVTRRWRIVVLPALLLWGLCSYGHASRSMTSHLRRLTQAVSVLPNVKVTPTPLASVTSVPAPAASIGLNSTPDESGGYGCAAALAYLATHAAPGFVSYCPHDAGGHQASTTCMDAPTCLAGTRFIWIADPCPAAYMNEASNSYVIIGQSDAPLDPYGYCGEPDNPLG